MIYAYGTPQEVERIGIKMSDKKIERAEKDFVLDIADRVALMNMFPMKGNYKLLKTMKWIHEHVWFRDEDREKLNLRQVQDGDNPPYFIWDENAIPEMTLSIGVEAQEVIATILRQMDKEERMGKEHFELYEQFCIGK